VYYTFNMKTLTVRLPDALAAEIQAESRRRKLSKSDVVRERLSADAGASRPGSAALDSIADLIGSVDELPADLSTRKKRYLRTTGYGRKRPR
jgi:Arc/MetJ-type ribon-helix-helix transcriptional regulator